MNLFASFSPCKPIEKNINHEKYYVLSSCVNKWGFYVVKRYNIGKKIYQKKRVWKGLNIF